MSSDAKKTPAVTPWRFVILMSLLMSFVALTIDAMLPALDFIEHDLKIKNPNDAQLIVTFVFFGMGLGTIFFGPFSDSYGRKNAIYIGLLVFIVGCLLSIFSESLFVMLIGRLLQGIGGSSCRVVTMSMVRDKFEGQMMAKIMSFVTMFFIFVPVLAPSVGQAILFISDWRGIFVFILMLSVVGGVWLMLGTEETLSKERRLPFTHRTIMNGIMETYNNKQTRSYTIALGLIFGALLTYLNVSQQMLQEQYALGEWFALIFGLIALGIGLASYANSQWVEKYGMVFVCKKALWVFSLTTALFLLYSLWFAGHPPLVSLIVYLEIIFFCFGLLFGNFSALAIQPLGHIAGVANSTIGACQILLSVVIGGVIGYSYNGTVTSIVLGFLILAVTALWLVKRTEKMS